MSSTILSGWMVAHVAHYKMYFKSRGTLKSTEVKFCMSMAVSVTKICINMIVCIHGFLDVPQLPGAILNKPLGHIFLCSHVWDNLFMNKR